MADDWRLVSRDSTSSASDVVNVSLASADHVPDSPYRALRANGAGVIVVDTLGGTNRTLNFAAGETRPVYVTKIYKTGTTANGIEGLL